MNLAPEMVKRLWEAWEGSAGTEDYTRVMEIATLAIEEAVAAGANVTPRQGRYLCDVVREHESPEAGDLLALALCRRNSDEVGRKG